MKSLFLACALFFASSQAFAYFFPVNAQLQVHPHFVTAVVANQFYEPVECVVVAFGRLNNGQVIQSHIRDIVPMHQFRQAHVYSNIPGLFFVHGWAEAYCRFLR